MTMIAACLIQDGAAMIADSRVTWLGGRVPLFQDSLQKILPLDKRIAIGFAGDVQAAGLIIGQLRRRMQKKPRLLILSKLAAEIPRIAKHYFKFYQSRMNRHEPVAFILGGVTLAGNIEIWWFQSPNFMSCKLREGFIVLGSGDVVAPYIKKNLESFIRDFHDLKSRVDAISIGIEIELQKQSVESVGGLLQVIILDPGGIRPLNRYFMDINPEGPARAKSMEMKAGRWVQRNLTTGLEVPLIEPAGLLRSLPTQVRFHDFNLPSGEPISPKWHLTYFLTCLAIKESVGIIEFRGVLSALASPSFPISIKLLAVIGFWGIVGDHQIEISLVQDGRFENVHSEPIHIEYPTEDFELAREITLNVPAPGPAFLECRIAGQLLGRRALYFGQTSGPPPEHEAELLDFGRLQSESLLEAQRACSDPVLENSGESTLVYFSICQKSIDEGMLLRFEGQTMAVYGKSYPLKLRMFIASAFRMPKGEHYLRVDLVNAATREISPITTATVSSTSSCLVVPIHGELIAVIPCSGIYFINIYVDDRLVGTTLLPAETDRPKFSYSLPKEYEEKIAAGELMILLKRAHQQSAK